MKQERLFVVVHEPRRGHREAFVVSIQLVNAKSAADAISRAEGMQDPIFKRAYAYPAEAGLILNI
jgi:hypothetical protein